MKIAYVNMQFPVPSETFAVLDAKALRDQGHDLRMFCMRPRHSEYDSLRDQRGLADIPIEHLSITNGFRGLLFGLSHPLIFIALLKWILQFGIAAPKHFIKTILLIPSTLYIFQAIQKFRPDVVHLFWGHYPSLVGLLVAKFLPRIVVSSFLGAHDLVYDYAGSKALSLKLDAFFTHAHANLPDLKKKGFSALPQVVHRGIDTQNQASPLANKFDNLEHPIFVSAGRLIQDKGFEETIRIFSFICSNYPTAKLLIMGDGPLKQSLQILAAQLGISSAVRFYGHIPQQTFIEHLSSAHFFFLLSRYASERLPNVVKEAMFQECVCLVAPSIGIEELIADQHSGFITNNEDCAKNLLHELMNDKNRCAALAKQARTAVSNHFDVFSSMMSYTETWQRAKVRKLANEANMETM